MMLNMRLNKEYNSDNSDDNSPIFKKNDRFVNIST
jgi:hypothetical protein